MPKEMIISVNGREKKIAILDNGQVTEFYIERGEENSGVVGNIYKGRVQRVLPGMQSAFVEIGLERDAFLYVSDFFDEEEEIEKIILDKSKKSTPEAIEREVTEHLHKVRLEREHQIESVQDLAEPLVAERGEKFEKIEDKEETEVFEPASEKVSEPINDEQKGRGGKSRRDRNDRNDRNRRNDRPKAEDDTNKESQAEKPQVEEIAAPLFEIEDSGFERIVDEETTGEMFKDAYMQEAIVDRVRAVEFDMESTATAEVGSLFSSVSDGANGFERIADEEIIIEEKPTENRSSKNNRNNRGKRPQKKTSNVVETPVVVKEIAPVAEESKQEQPKKSSKGKPQSPQSKSSKGKQGNKKSGKDKTVEEGEASVKESVVTSEMAVRRGGRRRRPGTGNNPQQNRVQGEEPTENVDSVGEVEESPVETNGANQPRSGYQGGNGRRRDNNRDRSQPTITDLLREGQEILVQIAKEPIARKGARITSHIALPGRYLVYMPTIEHVGVSRKIESANERGRLRTIIQKIRNEEDVPSGGFIVRTAGVGITDENLRDDARYLVRTWKDIKKGADKSKSPALVHQDLDLIQRILRDQLSEEFAAIRVDSEEEYLQIVEFVNRIQPKMVNRVKLYTRDQPIMEYFGVQEEIDKAIKPRVWLRSGGYIVINQTEALVSIDVNTGKFVGKGNARLEDTITKTNMEAVDEIARQIRLRDLGGIIVLDLIDMEDRRNRHKVLGALQEALLTDKSPTKVLSFNDFGLVIMTRKRVKQSLERTLCSPCSYCQGAGLIKSPQTVCYEILDEARSLSKGMDDVRQTTLRVNPEVAKALHSTEKVVLEELEAYLGAIDLTSDVSVHQEQFDFAFI
jgi:ribonuclease G